MAITEEDRAARRRAVDAARASVELERGRLSARFREVEETLVGGEANLDKLLATAKTSQ